MQKTAFFIGLQEQYIHIYIYIYIYIYGYSIMGVVFAVLILFFPEAPVSCDKMIKEF